MEIENAFLILLGGVYSLEGTTLGEVTGLSYQQWSENWKKKYGSS
jgi:hypothetical protein